MTAFSNHESVYTSVGGNKIINLAFPFHAVGNQSISIFELHKVSFSLVFVFCFLAVCFAHLAELFSIVEAIRVIEVGFLFDLNICLFSYFN